MASVYACLLLESGHLTCFQAGTRGVEASVRVQPVPQSLRLPGTAGRALDLLVHLRAAWPWDTWSVICYTLAFRSLGFQKAKL